MGPRQAALLCLFSTSLFIAEARAGTRWRGESVEIQVEPSLRRLTPDADDVVARAAERWSVVEGAPTLRVTASTLERGPGYHPREQTNSITFAAEGSELVGAALAITLLTYDADTLELLDADVIFNGHQRLLDVSSCEPDAGALAYDFESVLQHELGHVLGLEEDLQHSEAVMYPYASPWSVRSRSLQRADEEALQALYATPLAERPMGCSARVAPTPVPITVWNWAFALGVVSAALARRRRRGWTGVAVAGGALAVVSSAAAHAWAGEPLAGASEPVVGLARLEVVAASSHWEAGLIYTHLQLATRECDPQLCAELPNRLRLVGGSRDGVVQVLGHEPVPRVGAFLEVVAPPPRAGNRFEPSRYRTVLKTKGGESLWIQ